MSWRKQGSREMNKLADIRKTKHTGECRYRGVVTPETNMKRNMLAPTQADDDPEDCVGLDCPVG